MATKPTASQLTKKEKALTPKQRKWATLVASGGYTDVEAYQEAYQVKQASAETSAWRNRADPRVMQLVLQIRGEVTKAYAQLLSRDTKVGRLIEIALTGKDGDSIRAITELNRMEEADGQKDGDRFTDILIRIAERRRKLPHEESNDIIEI
ncbi:MAG: hypothetical protein ACYTGH_21700 [Planctomycetota bacterium]